MIFCSKLRILNKNSYFKQYDNIFNFIITTNNIYNFKYFFLNNYIFYKALIKQKLIKK